MVSFLFTLIIGLLLVGVLFYIIKWVVTRFFPEIAQPVIMVIGVLILVVFLIFLWDAFPGFQHHGPYIR